MGLGLGGPEPEGWPHHRFCFGADGFLPRESGGLEPRRSEASTGSDSSSLLPFQSEQNHATQFPRVYHRSEATGVGKQKS